jgi:hypothetical protein
VSVKMIESPPSPSVIAFREATSVMTFPALGYYAHDRASGDIRPGLRGQH